MAIELAFGGEGRGHGQLPVEGMGRVLAHTKAWQQLARIEAGLRKPQPRRTGDRSSIVAAIVRQPGVRPVASAGDEGLDLLFILRGGSTDPNQGSRWSGQVGFPGGHVEEHETDLEAVSRECREELGIRDLAGAGYRPLGRIADRSVYRTEKQSSLLVRCYVFEQLVHEDLTPDPAEVSACGWAPLRSLLSDQLVQPLPTVSRSPNALCAPTARSISVTSISPWATFCAHRLPAALACGVATPPCCFQCAMRTCPCQSVGPSTSAKRERGLHCGG